MSDISLLPFHWRLQWLLPSNYVACKLDTNSVFNSNLGTRCSRSMGFMAYGVGHPSYFFWEWHLLKGFIQHQTLQVVHPNSERLEHEDHLQIQNLEELREVHGFYINIIHFQISYYCIFLKLQLLEFDGSQTCEPVVRSLCHQLCPLALCWSQYWQSLGCCYEHKGSFSVHIPSFISLIGTAKMLVFCCNDMHINLPSFAGRNRSSWAWMRCYRWAAAKLVWNLPGHLSSEGLGNSAKDMFFFFDVF